MIYEITKEGAEVLKKKLESIGEISDEIKQLAQDMKESMIAAKGVGLAGNQVGKDLAIFVIDKNLAEKHYVPEVYINPEITEYSDETDSMEEGCLSIPGWWRSITRSKKVKIKFTDIDGNKIRLRARGFLARVFQHEFDHLQGMTIRNRSENK